MQYSPVIMIGN